MYNNTDNEYKIYEDLAKTSFKEGHRNHNSSKYPSCINKKEFSKYVYQVKD